jgi:hypothetical protein
VRLLGVIEGPRRPDLRRDPVVAPREENLLIGVADRGGEPVLLRGVREDQGTVLRPDVVPLPHPLRRVVFSKNSFRSCPNATAAGSKTTRTTSACPVRPVHTSLYVGFGVSPPE